MKLWIKIQIARLIRIVAVIGMIFTAPITIFAASQASTGTPTTTLNFSLKQLTEGEYVVVCSQTSYLSCAKNATYNFDKNSTKTSTFTVTVSNTTAALANNEFQIGIMQTNTGQACTMTLTYTPGTAGEPPTVSDKNVYCGHPTELINFSNFPNGNTSCSGSDCTLTVTN